MKPDRVRYFIIAVTGQPITSVFYNWLPDSPDECIGVFAETEISNVHESTLHARYSAHVRIARDTDDIVGEARARMIFNAVRSMHNRMIFFGAYLSYKMNNVSNPVIFMPDDNGASPKSKSDAFNIDDYILIGSEILQVTAKNGNKITATRAKLGTAVAIHADNSQVWNISQSPIPGERCGSAFATEGVMSLGLDDKNRRIWAVNWTVRTK